MLAPKTTTARCLTMAVVVLSSTSVAQEFGRPPHRDRARPAATIERADIPALIATINDGPAPAAGKPTPAARRLIAIGEPALRPCLEAFASSEDEKARVQLKLVIDSIAEVIAARLSERRRQADYFFPLKEKESGSAGDDEPFRFVVRQDFQVFFATYELQSLTLCPSDAVTQRRASVTKWEQWLDEHQRGGSVEKWKRELYGEPQTENHELDPRLRAPRSFSDLES